jgi:glycopeptide antibiotics resistance protein
VAAFLAAALIVYGSLIPFDFRAPTGGGDARGFAPLALAGTSRTDFLSNVLLFLPLPFFLMGAICAGRRPAAVVAAAAGVAPLATAALVWAVEWFQQFLPSRTASWNDVAAALVASALAVVLWLATGEPLTCRARRVLAERQPRSRLEAALLVYAVVIAVLQLLPLDVTIRPAELAEKYREGRVLFVPFASDPPVTLAGVRDWAGDVLAAIPFGVLGVIAWLPVGARRSPLGAFAAGVSFVASIEAAQLFVFSRVFDVTDLVTGAAGVAVGIGVASRVRGYDPARAPASRRGWALAALAAWTIVLLVRHWYPFHFTFDAADVRGRLPALLAVPFSAYYSANPFSALNEAVGKVMLAVPVGALLWLLVTPPSMPAALRRALILGLALFLFVAIECGQLFLRGRYPDITDVIIGLAGAAIGMGVLRLVRTSG